MLKKYHHVAVFCADYGRSYDFYVNKLGFTVEQETYREAQRDYIRMLRSGDVVLELFDRDNLTAPGENPPGLRHLAFHVEDIEPVVRWLNSMGIETEPVRVDAVNGGRFTFFKDPDGLPLEIHE